MFGPAAGPVPCRLMTRISTPIVQSLMFYTVVLYSVVQAQAPGLS